MSPIPDLARPLESEVAAVTGASRSIGAAVARAISQAGASGALAARDQRALREIADELNHDGGRAVAVPTDVTDADAVGRLVDDVVSVYERLDLACNDAAGGGHPPKPLAGGSAEEFDSAFTTSADVYRLSTLDGRQAHAVRSRCAA